MWLTKAQLSKKYDSESIAETIVQAKNADPEAKKNEVKPHPDAPECEASCNLQCDLGFACTSGLC